MQGTRFKKVGGLEPWSPRSTAAEPAGTCVVGTQPAAQHRDNRQEGEGPNARRAGPEPGECWEPVATVLALFKIQQGRELCGVRKTT